MESAGDLELLRQNFTGPACPLTVTTEDLSTTSATHYTLPVLAAQGTQQSPVNILTSNSQSLEALQFEFIQPEQGFANVTFTGETVQLNYFQGGHITYGGEEYELLQVHFHTPSEHHVDGVTFPMEMHIVNRRLETEGVVPRYVVIAMLVKMGRSNDFIDGFVDMTPVAPEGAVAFDPSTVYLSDGFDMAATHQYFHYKGSLTTPPYTETVDWLVREDIQEASAEQIVCINVIEGDNARTLQNLGERSIALH